MKTQQGDLSLLHDPVAQHLLESRIPARLAYTWEDGSPRVVPIGFHWNGTELVFGTPVDAPKLKVLRDGVPVAVTIDSESMPCHVLLLRGNVQVDVVDGIAPEYALMVRRTQGDRGWAGVAGPTGAHLPADGPDPSASDLGRSPRFRNPLPERTRARNGTRTGLKRRPARADAGPVPNCWTAFS